jgi:very-short-patch-repair endonuclease
MAQSDFLNSGRLASAHVSAKGGPRKISDGLLGHQLPRALVAEFVLGAPRGSVTALGGIDGESLRGLLDQVERTQHGRIALFARIVPEPTTEAMVEQVIDLLAETARRLWPIWFTNVSFSVCRNDTLGRLAVGAIARGVAQEIPNLSPSWIEEAARLVLDDRPPRVDGTPLAVEFSILSLAISRSGLVLVVDVGAAILVAPNPAAVVRALEWIARAWQGSVIALFADLPSSEPPFDRILYGSRQVIPEIVALPHEALGQSDIGSEPWIAPWRGLPHPLSDIEKRLAQAISADIELAPLFAFNQLVDTVRGSRPKVDLLWPAGRLVVELDGYGSHGNRTSFMYDRHRDYELTLSGYTVLRLANDEIAQDCGKAIEKIRDLVKLRRMQIIQEG